MFEYANSNPQIEKNQSVMRNVLANPLTIIVAAVNLILFIMTFVSMGNFFDMVGDEGGFLVFMFMLLPVGAYGLTAAGFALMFFNSVSNGSPSGRLSGSRMFKAASILNMVYSSIMSIVLIFAIAAIDEARRHASIWGYYSSTDNSAYDTAKTVLVFMIIFIMTQAVGMLCFAGTMVKNNKAERLSSGASVFFGVMNAILAFFYFIVLVSGEKIEDALEYFEADGLVAYIIFSMLAYGAMAAFGFCYGGMVNKGVKNSQQSFDSQPYGGQNFGYQPNNAGFNQPYNNTNINNTGYNNTAYNVPPQQNAGFVPKFCPKCGTPTTAGVQFCSKCGNRLV